MAVNGVYLLDDVFLRISNNFRCTKASISKNAQGLQSATRSRKLLESPKNDNKPRKKLYQRLHGSAQKWPLLSGLHVLVPGTAGFGYPE